MIKKAIINNNEYSYNENNINDYGTSNNNNYNNNNINNNDDSCIYECIYMRHSVRSHFGSSKFGPRICEHDRRRSLCADCKHSGRVTAVGQQQKKNQHQQLCLNQYHRY